MAAGMRLTGREAIEYARKHGLALHKYADPTEGSRADLTIEEAEAVIAEDPGLVWIKEATPTRPKTSRRRSHSNR